MTADSAFLSIRGLEKSYGSVTAISEVELDVHKGELVTLLGPSGSGKTTLLMAIAGFAVPERGKILLAGEDIAGLPPSRRGIGVVFQQYALFPHLSVAGNIAYPLAIRRVPRRERAAAVADALRLVRLDGMGDRLPRQLSGGQQQRVALARALVFKPPVLLMDEPLGALDRKLRAEMQLEIRRIQRTLGITTVYVTHDQEEALTISDRIAIVHQGRIEQIGTPAAIYRRPASAFVADFIGESNVFRGRIDRVADGGALLRAAGDIDFALDRSDPLAGEEDIVAVVRPEDVAVSAEACALSPHHGRLEQVIYLGSILRLQIATASGQRVSATVKPGLLPRLPAENGEIWFGWKPEDPMFVRSRSAGITQSPGRQS